MFRLTELFNIDPKQRSLAHTPPRGDVDRSSATPYPIEGEELQDRGSSHTETLTTDEAGDVALMQGGERVPSASAPATQPADEESVRQDQRITVLFVEDEALIRISAADFLHDAGLIVVEAGSAKEALAAVDDVRIDIAVTDVHLPEMSGPQLVLKIREVLPDLPVVFATGDSDVPEAEGLSRMALITKPYDYEALAALIRGMVAQR